MQHQPQTTGANATGRRPTKRRPRGSLSHEEILQAAHELVERDGLDAFSMSALAHHIGCGVASTYWYYRNKSELIGALAERVTAEVHAQLPPLATDAPWDEAYRGRLAAFRDEFRKSRSFVELAGVLRSTLNSRAPVGEMIMGRFEEAIGLLLAVGFQPDEAARIHATCVGYVRGFVIQEQGWLTDSALPAPALRLAVVPNAESFPLTSRVSDLFDVTDYGDELFVFGLDFLLDAVRYRASRPRPTS